MREFYLRRIPIIVLIFAFFVAIFSFSCVILTADAYGEVYQVSNETQVKDFLNKLKNYSYYADDIYIGTTEDIDMQDYMHSTFSFTDIEKYPGETGIVNVYFNVAIKNVYNYNGDEISSNRHYGLFSDVENHSISVYYKVNFDFGVGSGIAPCSYYTYSGEEIDMPAVISPEGKTFLGWLEEGSSEYVTKISANTWGVKNYVAIYEDVVTEPEIPDGPGNEPQPLTYPIVYQNTMDASGVDALPTTYVEGEETGLVSLDKEGFVFMGWMANGTVIEGLNATLQEGVLQEDKICLSAVWELESPSLDNLNNINKTYDGVASKLSCEVYHPILNQLQVAYEWFKVDGENQSIISTEREISFKNAIENGSYKVKIEVTHEESGLSKVVESNVVSVTVSKRDLTIEKKEGDYEFNKIYDGNTTCLDTFILDQHYLLNGRVNEEIIGTEILSKEYSSSNAGRVSIKVVVGIVGEESVLSNYNYAPTTIIYDATIYQKEVTLEKVSSPIISKCYDGTTSVDYCFVAGVDYQLVGAVYEPSHALSATFTSAVANDNAKIVLSVLLQDDNHFLNDDRLEYDARIERASLTLEKLTSPTLTKAYDGTVEVKGYQFIYGVDFEFNGAIDGEIASVNFIAVYDNESITAQKVILVPQEIIFSGSASANNYDYYKGTLELYYDGTITPKEVVVSGENLQREYEEKENLVFSIVTGIDSEEIMVRYLRDGGSDVGRYSYVGAEAMAPVNANYNVKFENKGYEYVIIPTVKVVDFPTFIARDYDENITLFDERLVDEISYEKVGTQYLHKYGVFEWVDGSTVPSALNEVGYDMVFIPSDTKNYDFSAMEGYSEEDKKVIRKVVLSVSQAIPNAVEVETEYLLPIGTRYNKITLPSGWAINTTMEITPSSIVSGEVGTSKVFEKALVYTHDASGNYKKVYKDLTVYFVATEIIYTCESEISRTGNFVIIERNPNDEIKVKIELINPFEKEGYKVGKWILSDGTEIPYGETNEYYLTNENLIAMTLTIAVTLVPRDDVKVTFKHYYESVEGNYLDEESLKIELNATADTTKHITVEDLRNKKGFTYKNSTLSNGEEVTSYLVSPLGDTVIHCYYERKTTLINYVDNEYSALNPEGYLPESKIVKYGVPFILEQPLNYFVLGYDFVGYKVGESTLYDLHYMVEEEVESITFSVEYRPRENAVYYVYRWIEGEVDVLTCYGKVGSVVSVENMEYIGHERVTNDLEVLSGTITGYLLDDEGNVVKGSILALHVYYKTLSYHLTLPEGVGSEILQNIKYGQSVTLPPALVSEGLEFLGWDVNGEWFAPESTFLMPAIDVVIKPIWKEKAIEESVSNDESKGVNPGVIIGIIVGAVAFLVIVGVVSSIVSKRQKSRAQLIEKLKVVNRNMFKK